MKSADEIATEIVHDHFSYSSDTWLKIAIAKAIDERDAEIERLNLDAAAFAEGSAEWEYEALTAKRELQSSQANCAALREALERLFIPAGTAQVTGYPKEEIKEYAAAMDAAAKVLASNPGGAALLARLKAHEDAVRVLDEALRLGSDALGSSGGVFWRERARAQAAELLKRGGG